MMYVCVCELYFTVFLYIGTSSASLTGFQLGATTAVCTSGLPVSGSVASAPAIGFSFGTSENAELIILTLS